MRWLLFRIKRSKFLPVQSHGWVSQTSRWVERVHTVNVFTWVLEYAKWVSGATNQSCGGLRSGRGAWRKWLVQNRKALSGIWKIFHIHTIVVVMCYFDLSKLIKLQTSSYDNYLFIQLLSREGVNIERKGWQIQLLNLNFCRIKKPEKATAPHSSTLPRKSHGWRILVGCSLWGH